VQSFLPAESLAANAPPAGGASAPRVAASGPSADATPSREEGQSTHGSPRFCFSTLRHAHAAAAFPWRRSLDRRGPPCTREAATAVVLGSAVLTPDRSSRRTVAKCGIARRQPALQSGGGLRHPYSSKSISAPRSSKNSMTSRGRCQPSSWCWPGSFSQPSGPIARSSSSPSPSASQAPK